MTSETLTLLLVYLLTLLLAATEMLPISIAAMVGALLTIWFGLSYHVFTYEEAMGFIDMKVLGLLIGTMIVLEVAHRGGIFHLLALYTIKISRGDQRLLFPLICMISAAISMFLSDSTALLLIAAAATTISKIMNYDPTPYFISAAIMVNLGGTSTLIGSVSNMVIGVTSGLSFMDFVNYLTPCEMILWILTTLTLFIYYRKKLREKRPVPEYNPWDVIKDRSLFNKSALILILFVGLFLVHDRLNVGPEAVALGCAVLALAMSGLNPSEIFQHLDWETIFFLGGFFLIIGGLERTGVLASLSQSILQLSGGSSLLAVILTLWLSGMASTAVSNIAIALTFTPVIRSLVSLNQVALWSALVFGTNLGGATTPMSGVVCILALNALRREGITVSFGDFAKVGGLTSLLQLCFSTIYLIFRFNLIGG